MAVSAGSLGLNLLVLAPLYVAPPRPELGGPPLGLLAFNVRTSNTAHREVLDEVRASDADLVVLLEVDEVWMEALRALEPDYRLVAARPRSDNSGIAFFSRVPILRATERTLTGPHDVAIEVELEHGRRRLAILGVHTYPPVGAWPAEARDRQLAAMAEWAATSTRSVVIAGDFNATPWSHAFRGLLQRGRLLDSQQGFGPQGSWPNNRGLPAFFAIPIDHVVHGRDLWVIERRLGDPAGSDHRPVFVRLEPIEPPRGAR